MASEAVSLLGEGDAEGGAPRGHSEANPHHKVNYFLIFYALIILTAVTIIVATTRFQNEWYNVGIALVVASTKATLVARFFMHLKFEGKLIRLALIFPLILCVIMIAGVFPDVGRGRDTVLNDTIEHFDHGIDGK